MPLILRLLAAPGPPVEAGPLLPTTLAPLRTSEVARIRLRVGNGEAEVGELFEVGGSAEDGHVVFEGNLGRFRRIGEGMEGGALSIRGDAGSHLGAGMKGGTIEVKGNVGDWAGAGMAGGRLSIRGGAGDHLGGAPPGARRGMVEGVILVEGDIGADAGLAMRRGLIAVSGRAGDDLGRAMIAGSIFLFGGAGARLGAGMRRGTIALFDGEGPSARDLLPSFAPTGRYRPPAVNLYLKALRGWGFPAPEAAFSGSFLRYNGDLVERGQGEILAWVP